MSGQELILHGSLDSRMCPLVSALLIADSLLVDTLPPKCTHDISCADKVPIPPLSIVQGLAALDELLKFWLT